IPRKDDRITLTSILNDGDTATAYLGISKYIMEYGKDEEAEADTNFRVKLYKNSSLVGSMLPSSRSGYYSINEIIEQENDYKIEVEYDGDDKAIGRCYTPPKPIIANAYIDTSNHVTTMSVDILDAVGVKNFYTIQIYQLDSTGNKYYQNFSVENPIPGTLLTNVSLLPGMSSSYYYYFSELFLSDKYYDGDKITIKVLANQYYNALTTPYFEVTQVTESYFEYVKTLQLAQNNDILGVIG